MRVSALAVDPNGSSTVSGPSATVDSEGEALATAARLLGVDPDFLVFSLCKRQIQTGSRSSIATKMLGNPPSPPPPRARFVGLFKGLGDLQQHLWGGGNWMIYFIVSSWAAL